MRNVLIVVIFLASFGCKPDNRYERELATMKRMQSMIDTTLVSLEAVDTTSYSFREKKMQHNLRVLTAMFTQKSDTIYRTQALLLSEYRNSWMPAKMLFPAWQASKLDLLFTRTQLESLQHDVVHNLLDERAVKESYRMELAATEKAIANAKNLLTLFDVGQQVEPVIAATIDSLLASSKTLE